MKKVYWGWAFLNHQTYFPDSHHLLQFLAPCLARPEGAAHPWLIKGARNTVVVGPGAMG